MNGEDRSTKDFAVAINYQNLSTESGLLMPRRPFKYAKTNVAFVCIFLSICCCVRGSDNPFLGNCRAVVQHKNWLALYKSSSRLQEV